MAITNAQIDKAWIDMINGKRKTAGGKIIRTKADLLEVKQYLPMVSQAVKDAYNKRMASFRDSADSVEAIAAKYGHEMQNDAFGQPASEVIGIANLKAQAQKAVDALWAASKKAGAAIAAYNKALGKSAKGGMAGFAEASKKMVDFHDVLNNLKSGANTRI